MQRGRDTSARALGLLLAQELATRMCHDLSGPLGGLVAALGEADEDPEAVAVARDAAAALRRRLALLRAAWGAAAALTGASLRELAGGLPNAHKLRIELDQALAVAELIPAHARLALNALLLAAESLPLGGVLVLAGDPAGGLVLMPSGPRAAWPEGLGAMLASESRAWETLGHSGGLRAMRLQAVITALLAHAAGVPARLLLAGASQPVPPLLLDFSRLERDPA